MDNCQTGGICERHHATPAVGRHRQCEPGQERPESRYVEAPVDELLLRVCSVLGPGQVLLGIDHFLGGEDSLDEHAGHLLDVVGCVRFPRGGEAQSMRIGGPFQFVSCLYFQTVVVA